MKKIEDKYNEIYQSVYVCVCVYIMNDHLYWHSLYHSIKLEEISLLQDVCM
jgi:hypothetical protein